VAFWLVAGR